MLRKTVYLFLILTTLSVLDRPAKSTVITHEDSALCALKCFISLSNLRNVFSLNDDHSLSESMRRSRFARFEYLL